MKKKLLYFAIAFGFVISISATPAFTTEASACGTNFTHPLTCSAP
ncbi:hypothetical protein [Bacillus sp. Bva_UNVM-123]